MKQQIYKSNLFIVLILLFCFESILVQYFSWFSYYDELVISVSLIAFVIKFWREQRLTRKDFAFWGLILFTIGIGLINNLIFDIQPNKSAIWIDCFTSVKFFLAVELVWPLFYELDLKYTLYVLERIFTVITYVLFVLSLINLFVDIGLRDSVRFGIPAFKFVCENAGQFNYLCYYIIIILTACNFSKGNKFSLPLILSLFVWASTLRVRTFIFIAIYFLLYIYFMKVSKKLKATVSFILVLSVPLFIILSFNQTIKYFFNENSARSRLLTTSFQILADYFPFGTGFGTFGTASAATFYSPLYYKYSLSDVYGLTPENPAFAMDNYWPSVFAQLGLFGALCVLTMLYFSYVKISKRVNAPAFHFTFIVLCWILGLSSLVTASFYHYTSLGLIMFISVLSDEKMGGKKTYENFNRYCHSQVV